MTRFRFDVNPNTIGGAALDANPLTSIVQVVTPPAGKHFDTLLAMGYPFAGLPLPAFRTALISDVFFRLKDSGILDKLDWFFIATGDIAGSMINLIPSKSPAINGGATYSAGAIRTSGGATYFDANFALNKGKMTATDASAFIHVTVTPPLMTTGVLFGGSGTGQEFRFTRNAAANALQVRCNGLSTISTINSALWGPGLWSMSREGADSVIAYKNADQIASGTIATTSPLPPNIHAGRVGDTVFTAQSFTCFGGGKGLTPAEIATLYSITSFHAAAIAALDAA